MGNLLGSKAKKKLRRIQKVGVTQGDGVRADLGDTTKDTTRLLYFKNLLT